VIRSSGSVVASDEEPSVVPTLEQQAAADSLAPVLELRNRRARRRDSVRVAFYSHDTLGLGHTRRNLLIASALTRLGMQVDILLITGTHAARQFALPPGADCLTLPSLRKDLDGSYASRSLDMPLAEIVDLRSRSIWAALQGFKPDLVIVDNVARGAAGELDLSLRKLAKKARTRCVLGLRDIQDAPEVARSQWASQRTTETLADYYDAVWIYGDPNVHATLDGRAIPPSLRDSVRYLGYFDPRIRVEPHAELSDEASAIVSWGAGRLVLCLVGGGQDGWRLAEAFAGLTFGPGERGVLVLGPFMHAEARRALHAVAAGRLDLRVVDFLSEPAELLPHAARVISMGGYNTVLEALAFEVPLLVVPRVEPRQEQLYRAMRLRDLGLLDVVHPDSLDSRALAAWLGRDVAPPEARSRLDFTAAQRLQPAIEEVLGRALVPRRPRQATKEDHDGG
jgi:predicted glycosyltransferase